MRDKRVFTVTRKLQGLLLGVDGLTLKKAVTNFPELMKISLATKQEEFRGNPNPSNSSTRANKVAQTKRDPRVPHSKKSKVATGK